MTKKIGLLLLSLFIFFGFGVSFANPISDFNPNYLCSMFENVEIDNYRVVVQNGSEFYEPKIKECSECEGSYKRSYDNGDGWGVVYEWAISGPTQNVYLLDKSIGIENIKVEGVESNSIPIGFITSTYCDRSYNETKVYKIIKSGNSYTMLDRTNHYNVVQEMKNKLKQFPIFLFLTVIIETLVLFFIAKIFRKEEGITNKKLFLFGIVPTTITLPLLRFFLPLVLGEGTRYTIFGETLVTIIEALIIKYGLNISWKESLITSIICNVFSFVILSIDRYYDTRLRLRLTFLIVLIETIILIIVAKILRKKDKISNKKLALLGLVAPIISFWLMILLIKILDNLPSIREDTIYFAFGFEISEWAEYFAIGIKILVEVLIIKYLRKISRGKAITIGILCNLSIPIIISLLEIFIGLI